MESRAVALRQPRRTLWAGIVMAGLLAVVLGPYFATSWRESVAERTRLVDATRVVANMRAAEIARGLASQLDGLIARESERPYFHYQNLFHDPKASGGSNVAPSPLARGPQDPLVLGYFEIDAQGRVTTPTVNDDMPDLSDPSHLAEHRAFRDEAVRSLTSLRASGPLIAANTVHIDANSYALNNAPNAAYTNPSPSPSPSPSPISITVSTLEWHTLPFAGAPSLVAVRHVATPDGTLVQGFVVDRATLTHGLAEAAGDMVAELHSDGRAGAPIAPGWQLTVTPNPLAVMRAKSEARGLERELEIRLAAIGIAAVLAAALIVLLVSRAERLARERSQFAAAAAHELRTPLAGLQLYGDMLADGLGDPDKAREYAKRMSEEAARLGRVVSNVLGFSQLERGKLGVDAQIGALGEALRELADRAQPALDRAGAALDLDVAPELRARFDRDALARIVANLLDNAEKYARAADDRTIALAARDRGDRVEIEVRDRGAGVADPAALFKPFARGVDADGPAGLGLGLALSRSLARAMGGDLEYRGDAAGAVFVVTLPRA